MFHVPQTSISYAAIVVIVYCLTWILTNVCFATIRGIAKILKLGLTYM